MCATKSVTKYKKIQIQKYKKAYRKEWERDPDLKSWIAPGKEEGKAHCKYCNVDIRAHFKDLKDHATTKKHMTKC